MPYGTACYKTCCIVLTHFNCYYVVNRSIAQVKYVLWNYDPLGLCLFDAICKVVLPFEHVVGRIDITQLLEVCPR